MLAVVHEDADLLVVNKPAGLVCHPTRNGELSSLVGRVRLYLGHREGRLVNRLDRETSGIVLIAKHADAAGQLGKALATRAIHKQYWAIVHGQVSEPSMTIDLPIGRDLSSEVAIKDCVRPDGAPAVTDISLIRTFVRDGEPFSWLDVTPHSGRKHQIRIHLAHIGHPIVGDKIYGADERLYLRFIAGALSDADRRLLKVGHHALHARALSFDWRGRAWQFTADPGEEFSVWSWAISPRPSASTR